MGLRAIVGLRAILDTRRAEMDVLLLKTVLYLGEAGVRVQSSVEPELKLGPEPSHNSQNLAGRRVPPALLNLRGAPVQERLVQLAAGRDKIKKISCTFRNLLRLLRLLRRHRRLFPNLFLNVFSCNYFKNIKSPIASG